MLLHLGETKSLFTVYWLPLKRNKSQRDSKGALIIPNKQVNNSYSLKCNCHLISYLNFYTCLIGKTSRKQTRKTLAGKQCFSCLLSRVLIQKFFRFSLLTFSAIFIPKTTAMRCSTALFAWAICALLPESTRRRWPGASSLQPNGKRLEGRSRGKRRQHNYILYYIIHIILYIFIVFFWECGFEIMLIFAVASSSCKTMIQLIFSKEDEVDWT